MTKLSKSRTFRPPVPSGLENDPIIVELVQEESQLIFPDTYDLSFHNEIGAYVLTPTEQMVSRQEILTQESVEKMNNYTKNVSGYNEGETIPESPNQSQPASYSTTIPLHWDFDAQRRLGMLKSKRELWAQVEREEMAFAMGNKPEKSLPEPKGKGKLKKSPSPYARGSRTPKPVGSRSELARFLSQEMEEDLFDAPLSPPAVHMESQELPLHIQTNTTNLRRSDKKSKKRKASDDEGQQTLNFITGSRLKARKIETIAENDEDLSDDEKQKRANAQAKLEKYEANIAKYAYDPIQKRTDLFRQVRPMSSDNADFFVPFPHILQEIIDEM